MTRMRAVPWYEWPFEPVRWVFIACVWLYRQTLSRIMPDVCRFQPTCGAYCLEALQKRGLFVGGWLGLRRLLRCHPWGGFGFDPVPERPGPRA